MPSARRSVAVMSDEWPPSSIRRAPEDRFLRVDAHPSDVAVCYQLSLLRPLLFTAVHPD